MADSLLFDGTDDKINLSLGGVPGFGPGMLGVVLKSADITTENRVAVSFSTDCDVYRRLSDDRISLWTGTEHTGPVLADDTWYACFITKASGTVTPRWHVYNYGSSSWTHVDSGAGTQVNTTASGTVQIGALGTAEYWNGSILIAGAWNSDFSDAAVEALGLHNGLQGWVNSTPREAWRLNRTSTIMSLSRTSVESSRVGTALDTGDVPAGWLDTLNQKIVIEKGVFTSPATTGVQTYNLGTLFDGVLPKAVVLWTSLQSSDGALNDDANLLMGMGTRDGGASQQWANSFFGDDTVSTSGNVKSWYNNAILNGVESDTSTPSVVATLDSFTAGTPSDFRINWTDIPAAQITVHYLCLGGDDIIQARVGSPAMQGAGIALSDMPMGGTGMNPDAALMMGVVWSSVNSTSQGTARIWMGAWTEKKGVIEQRSEQMAEDEGTTTNVAAWSKNSALAAVGNTLAADVDAVVTARRERWGGSSFLLDSSAQTQDFGYSIGVLGLRGTFAANVGMTTIPQVTGDQQLSISNGKPKGAIFFGQNLGDSADRDITTSGLGAFTVGATDGFIEGLSGIALYDNTSGSKTSRFMSTTKAFARYLADAGGGAATVDAEADSSLSGSNVVLNWTDAASANSTFSYLIIGERTNPISYNQSRHPKLKLRR